MDIGLRSGGGGDSGNIGEIVVYVYPSRQVLDNRNRAETRTVASRIRRTVVLEGTSMMQRVDA